MHEDTCVATAGEIDELQERITALEAEVGRLRAALSRRPEEQYLHNTPHTEKSACPMWYGECLCTVSELIHNIERADKAEAEIKRLREACELVYKRVQRIQQQGRIVVPAALWILDRLHAALEPDALELAPKEETC